jgi:hypothetical protein
MKTYKQFIEESIKRGFMRGAKDAVGNVVNIVKATGNLPTTTASFLGKKIKKSGIEASRSKNNSTRLTKGLLRYKIGSSLEKLGS